MSVVDKTKRHKCVVCKGDQVWWSEREYSWVCQECEEFYDEDYFFGGAIIMTNEQSIKDAEYLARPLIEDVTFIIEKDYVKISCPHTLFTNSRRIAPYGKDELLSLYKNVFRQAKTAGVKISFTRHFRKTLTERWAEYENCCHSAIALFDGITIQAKLIRARGIHIGTTDDVELGKLTTLRDELDKLNWRNNIASIIAGIFRSLKETERNMANLSSAGLYKIYL